MNVFDEFFTVTRRITISCFSKSIAFPKKINTFRDYCFVTSNITFSENNAIHSIYGVLQLPDRTSWNDWVWLKQEKSSDNVWSYLVWFSVNLCVWALTTQSYNAILGKGIQYLWIWYTHLSYHSLYDVKASKRHIHQWRSWKYL